MTLNGWNHFLEVRIYLTAECFDVGWRFMTLDKHKASFSKCHLVSVTEDDNVLTVLHLVKSLSAMLTLLEINISLFVPNCEYM